MACEEIDGMHMMSAYTNTITRALLTYIALLLAFRIDPNIAGSQ